LPWLLLLLLLLLRAAAAALHSLRTTSLRFNMSSHHARSGQQG